MQRRIDRTRPRAGACMRFARRTSHAGAGLVALPTVSAWPLDGRAVRDGSAFGVGSEPRDGFAIQSEPAVPEQDAWRLFRGTSSLTGVAATELPDNPAPLWVFEAEDSIESTAAIADGVAYAGSLDSYFYAIDLESGELLWKYQASMEIRSSPTIVDGTVYFGDEGGQFHALDARTGEAAGCSAPAPGSSRVPTTSTDDSCSAPTTISSIAWMRTTAR